MFMMSDEYQPVIYNTGGLFWFSTFGCFVSYGEMVLNLMHHTPESFDGNYHKNNEYKIGQAQLK